MDCICKCWKDKELKIHCARCDGIVNYIKCVKVNEEDDIKIKIQKLKKELYKDHTEKMDEKRKIFEENRYGYNRNKILAWNSFIKKPHRLYFGNEFNTNRKKLLTTDETKKDTQFNQDTYISNCV